MENKQTTENNDPGKDQELAGDSIPMASPAGAAEVDYKLLGKIIDKQLTKSNRQTVKELQKQFNRFIRENQKNFDRVDRENRRLLKTVEELQSFQRHLHHQLELHQEREKLAVLREQQDVKRIRDLEDRLSFLLMSPIKDSAITINDPSRTPIAIQPAELVEPVHDGGHNNMPGQSSEEYPSEKDPYGSNGDFPAEEIPPERDGLYTTLASTEDSEDAPVIGGEAEGTFGQLISESAGSVSGDPVGTEIAADRLESFESQNDDNEDAGELIPVSGGIVTAENERFAAEPIFGGRSGTDAGHLAEEEGLAAAPEEGPDDIIIELEGDGAFSEAMPAPDATADLDPDPVTAIPDSDADSKVTDGDDADDGIIDLRDEISLEAPGEEVEDRETEVSETAAPVDVEMPGMVFDPDEGLDYGGPTEWPGSSHPASEDLHSDGDFVLDAVDIIELSEENIVDRYPESVDNFHVPETESIAAEGSGEQLALQAQNDGPADPLFDEPPGEDLAAHTPEKLFRRGKAACQSKDYSQAAMHFEQFVASAPDEPRGHYNLALLYYRLKNYPDARKHAARAFELNYTPAERILKKIEVKLNAKIEPDDQAVVLPKEAGQEERIILQEITGGAAGMPLDDETLLYEPDILPHFNRDTVEYELLEDPADEPYDLLNPVDEDLKITETPATVVTEDPVGGSTETLAPASCPEYPTVDEGVDMFPPDSTGFDTDRPDGGAAMMAADVRNEETAPESTVPPIGGFEKTDPLSAVDDPPHTVGSSAGDDLEENLFSPWQTKVDTEEAGDSSIAEPTSQEADEQGRTDLEFHDHETDDSVESTEEAIPASQFFTQAMAAAKDKDYEQAIGCFEDYIDQLPEEPKGHYNLAILHYRNRNYEKAAEYANRALQLGAKSSQKILDKIEAKRLQTEPRGANPPVEEPTGLLLSDRSNFPASELETTNHKEDTASIWDADELEGDISGSIISAAAGDYSFDPSDDGILFNSGMAPAEGHRDPDEVLPESGSTLDDLKISVLQHAAAPTAPSSEIRGDTGAVSDGSDVKSAHGNGRLQNLFDLGQKAIESNEYLKAIKHFTKVTHIAPEDPRGYYYLAVVSCRLKFYETAREHATRAIKLGSEPAKRVLEEISADQTGP